MNLKFNFVKDCIKLFLFNEKSFKNIQKEKLLTPILWLVIPITSFLVIYSSVLGFMESFTSGIFSFLIGILSSIILILIAASFATVYYGFTHLILKAFGSKIKFKENLKLQLSTYSIGLTIWSIPLIILSMIFSQTYLLVSQITSLILGAISFVVYIGLSIWYYVVIITYLAKLNKTTKLISSLAVLLLPMLIITILILINLI